MRILFSAVAALFITSSAVNAGEYAAKPDRWSGCYGGVNAGYMSGQTKFDITTIAGFILGVAATQSNPGTPIYGNRTEKFSPNGATFGLQIGCSKQINNFVVGLEAEANYSFADHKRKTVENYAGNYTDYTTDSWKFNGVGNIRLRGGYAVVIFYHS